MICIDFEYAEHKLSDFNCIICSINNESESSSDSILTYNTLTSRNNKFNLLYSEYKDPLKFKMEIAKNPCVEGYNMEFSALEIEKLKTWLNRREFLKFSPIYDEKDGFPNTYCHGSFNIDKTIIIGGKIVGLDVSFTADAPYLYYESKQYNHTFNSTNSYTIIGLSDEIGHDYINVEIKCLDDGDLRLYNSKTEDVTVIKNCKKNEVIKLNGKAKIISSSLQDTEHKTLYNDFNYSFPSIVREYSEMNSINVFTSTLACEVTMIYSPVCKLGVM